jgi:tetratricopeptide (TPR) repeat protein
MARGRCVILWIASMTLLLSPTAARAAIDIATDTAPWSWINPHLPEELPPQEYPAYYSDLDKARAQVLGGRYRLALQTLETLADAEPAEVATLKARALSAIGRAEEAIDVLSAEAVEKLPAVRIVKAQILSNLGRYTEALAMLRTVLLDEPGSIPARFWIGHLSEQIGDHESARAAYQWFLDKPQNFLERWQTNRERDPIFQSAENVTLIARAIDRWATLTGAYQDNRALHDTLLGMFVRAYDVIDRTYWPARLAAAVYLLGHGNSGEAQEELERVMAANPNHPDVLLLAGRAVVDRFSIDGGEETLQSLRRLSPELPQTRLLEARLLLLRRRPAQAAEVLQKLIDEQPANLEALGLLAATRAVQMRDDDAQHLLGLIEKLDPDNASAYAECGHQLEMYRQHARAEQYYVKAVERAPWWTEPRTNLGELYTQHGLEDKARAALEAAYALDPFNFKTVNYLRVLDELATFERYETEHFVFLYSQRDAAVVPTVIAEYMESMYADVTGIFRHEPPFKTIVEVFPDADAFAVRTAGMPGLESYGASVGMVITAVAPRAGKTLGPFNLARVLRHEFTHTMNMSATGDRCPRWLTEGLGVWQESVPFRFAWVPPVMYARAMNDQLFGLDEIDDALLRPRRGGDGEVAYMQSFWVVQYLLEKHGDDAIVRLLEQFNEGKQTSEAIPAITGEPLRMTEAKFNQWAKDRVKDWGYDKETATKFAEIEKEAEALTKSGDFEKAAALWEQAAKLQPLNTLPNRRLAGIYTRLKRPEQAIEHFEKILPLELQDNRYAKRVARLCRDLGKLDRAIDFATEAMYVDPYDPDAHALLAELYEATNDFDRAEKASRLADALKEAKAAPRAHPAR